MQYRSWAFIGSADLPWAEAGGVSLHHRLEGARGASVVFLHEIGGSLDSWQGVTPELAKTFRVLRYDQRGFGLSEKTRSPYGIGALVDDLQHLLATVDLPPPYH